MTSKRLLEVTLVVTGILACVGMGCEPRDRPPSGQVTDGSPGDRDAQADIGTNDAGDRDAGNECDCLEGQICQDGQCIPIGDTGRDAGGGDDCDPDCPAGQVCINGDCVDGCGERGVICPGGTTCCQDEGGEDRCMAGDCTCSPPCPPEQTCDLGECIDFCEEGPNYDAERCCENGETCCVCDGTSEQQAWCDRDPTLCPPACDCSNPVFCTGPEWEACQEQRCDCADPSTFDQCGPEDGCRCECQEGSPWARFCTDDECSKRCVCDPRSPNFAFCGPEDPCECACDPESPMHLFCDQPAEREECCNCDMPDRVHLCPDDAACECNCDAPMYRRFCSEEQCAPGCDCADPSSWNLCDQDDCRCDCNEPMAYQMQFCSGEQRTRCLPCDCDNPATCDTPQEFERECGCRCDDPSTWEACGQNECGCNCAASPAYQDRFCSPAEQELCLPCDCDRPGTCTAGEWDEQCVCDCGSFRTWDRCDGQCGCDCNESPAYRARFCDNEEQLWCMPCDCNVEGTCSAQEWQDQCAPRCDCADPDPAICRAGRCPCDCDAYADDPELFGLFCIDDPQCGEASSQIIRVRTWMEFCGGSHHLPGEDCGWRYEDWDVQCGGHVRYLNLNNREASPVEEILPEPRRGDLAERGNAQEDAELVWTCGVYAGVASQLTLRFHQPNPETGEARPNSIGYYMRGRGGETDILAHAQPFNGRQTLHQVVLEMRPRQ